MAFDMRNSESFDIHDLKNKFWCSFWEEETQEPVKGQNFEPKIQREQKKMKEQIEEKKKVTYFYGLRASQWLEQSSDEAPESTSDEAPWILYKA